MGPKISLYYSDSAYTETLHQPRGVMPGVPLGLMGREVAGKEFLDAYLSHGSWTELVALVPDSASLESIKRLCVTHDSSRNKKRRLQCVELGEFSDTFGTSPPANLIHFPGPPNASFAWSRQHVAGIQYALCGVTHTLCSIAAVEALRNLVIAPFEPYDRLVCTSDAVREMVRTVISNYSAYLRDRFGGQPRSLVPLEVIPLGVNCEKYRPATEDQRMAARAAYDVRDDEIVVLFMGRLSHHAKANPFPMFRSLSEASVASQKSVHLIMAGWAANEAILNAFKEGARRFAANVRATFVNGILAEHRRRVWHAADIFMSLADNIQETFGLVIVEAMASGLPVVATDWNGYRDLVVHGETGFLTRTCMLRDASGNLTMQLLTGEVNYDHFLARSSQQVAVDVASATQSLVRLIGNSNLRLSMARRGRRRAENHFDWQRIIRLHEELWCQQLREWASRSTISRDCSFATPSAYPRMGNTFARYPTTWLDETASVSANEERLDDLDPLLSLGLTNFEPTTRCDNRDLLRSCLETATGGCRIQQLLAQLGETGVHEMKAKATIAWMLKYDLLRVSGLDD